MRVAALQALVFFQRSAQTLPAAYDDVRVHRAILPVQNTRAGTEASWPVRLVRLRTLRLVQVPLRNLRALYIPPIVDRILIPGDRI